MDINNPLRDQWYSRVKEVARKLRRMADDVESLVENSNMTPLEMVDASGRITHTVNWGLANLHLDDLPRRAADAVRVAACGPKPYEDGSFTFDYDRASSNIQDPDKGNVTVRVTDNRTGEKQWIVTERAGATDRTWAAMVNRLSDTFGLNVSIEVPDANEY